MEQKYGFHRRTLVGPRLVKNSRGAVSFAAVLIATVMLVPAGASAQAVPLDCLPESSGPVPGDPAPHRGGMCDLESLRADSLGYSYAQAVSADGSTVVGQAQTDDSSSRGFRWIYDGSGMLDLGSLRTDNLGYSYAQSVSSDGSTVVGQAQTDDNESRAFRWINSGTGMLDLGSLRGDNLGYSYALAVSASGSTIVGQAQTDDNNYRAFRWLDNGSGMLDLGSLRADNLGYSYAQAVSNDGSTIVGGASTDDNNYRAFLWIDDGSGMLDLGSMRGDNLGYSYALAVSASGSTIVGQAQTDDNNSRAFRWINDGSGMLDLGSLRADNLGYSYAHAVSDDGSTIVGGANTDDNNYRAFRWIDDGTGMLDLGSLRTDNLAYSYAQAVSADGTTVVGAANTDDNNYRAFRWVDDGSGMLDLGSLRADNLGYSYAQAVSADGSTIVGQAETEDGNNRAFIWRVQMQDFENLMLSFPALANDTEIAVAQQQHVVDRLMNETCYAKAGRACLRVGGLLGSTGAQDIGSQSSSVATLSSGRGLDGQTTLGGNLSVNGSHLSANEFDRGTGVGVGLWSEHSEGGLARSGWQAGASISWGRESGTITRGRGLDNVMLATGDVSLETFGAHATLGYGFQQQDWLITPSATLAHFRTSRSAEVEDGADFNASYNASSMSRTTVTMALAGERKLAAQGKLALSFGAEYDLSADRAALTGTSMVPGMEGFSVGSTLNRNRMRGFFDIGYSHEMGGNRSLSGSVRVGQSAFGSTPRVDVGIHYHMRF